LIHFEHRGKVVSTRVSSGRGNKSLGSGKKVSGILQLSVWRTDIKFKGERVGVMNRPKLTYYTVGRNEEKLNPQEG